MLRYPRTAANWCLVPMNVVKQGPQDSLRSEGTFFLPAGPYLIFGTVAGSTGTVQCAIASVSSEPITFPFSGIVSQTIGSRVGDNIFFGVLQVEDQSSGGSVLGVYQYINGAIPNNAVGAGLRELYASLLIVPQFCQRPPLQLSVSQTGPSATTLPAKTWTPLWMNTVTGSSQLQESGSSGAYSFALPGGTYLVTGVVGASVSGGVACLATTGPSGAFDLSNVLLVSAGGSFGDCEFQGLVVIPAEGAQVAVFAYLIANEAVGVATGSNITQAYANMNFSLIGDAQGSSSQLYCCPPLVPIPCNFVVSETLPSGTLPEPSNVTSPTTACRQVLLNTLVGLPSSSLFAGTFLLPRGTWYVQGVTSGAAGRLPAQGVLARVGAGSVIFEQEDVLLKGTDCFSANSHFDGIVTVEAPTRVALFTTYPATGVPFGTPIKAGVPEVYSRLLFLYAPRPCQTV